MGQFEYTVVWVN